MEILKCCLVTFHHWIKCSAHIMFHELKFVSVLKQRSCMREEASLWDFAVSTEWCILSLEDPISVRVSFSQFFFHSHRINNTFLISVRNVSLSYSAHTTCLILWHVKQSDILIFNWCETRLSTTHDTVSLLFKTCIYLLPAGAGRDVGNYEKFCCLHAYMLNSASVVWIFSRWKREKGNKVNSSISI